MELTVFQYGKGIQDLLENVKSINANHTIEDLKTGKTSKKVTLELKDSKITLSHSGNVSLMPDQFYTFTARDFNFLSYKLIVDYIYTGKSRTYEKVAPYDEDPSRLLKSVLEIPYSELNTITLQTDLFKIIYSLKKMSENIIFEFKNKDVAKVFFRKLILLVYPYLKVSMNVEKIESNIEFKIINDNKAELLAKIKYDNSPMGVKTNIIEF